MKLLDAHVNGVPRHVSTKHCLTTAANMPTNIELETPQIKDVATTFFLQAVKHFNL